MRERGYLEKQGGGVCWHFECSLGRLQHLAVAEHRLEQPVVGIHSLEGEGMAQPRQLCVALSVGSFCAALMKISSEFSLSWSLLHQILGESSHGGRGAVLDVGEELGRHGMEEGSPQRRGEVGR